MMQILNMLETPRIRHYSPTGSEKVFGAVNQQARQPLAKALSTLAEEVGCQASEAIKGHLERDDGMVQPSGDGCGLCVGFGLVWPTTATAGKVKACHITSS